MHFHRVYLRVSLQQFQHIPTFGSLPLMTHASHLPGPPRFSIFNSHRTSVSLSCASTCTSHRAPAPSSASVHDRRNPPPHPLHTHTHTPSPPLPPSLLPAPISIPFSRGWSERGESLPVCVWFEPPSTRPVHIAPFNSFFDRSRTLARTRGPALAPNPHLSLPLICPQSPPLP